MFSQDSATVRSPDKVVCIVGSMKGLAVVRRTAESGRRVVLLWCDQESPPAELTRMGIHVYRLEEQELPAAMRLANILGDGPAEKSDRVRYALERLHARHQFDVIEFVSPTELSFRSVQAQRCGLAFADVPLTVRDAEIGGQRPMHPLSLVDVEADYCERYTLENVSTRSSIRTQPLVTLCVPHHNLGRHLPDTLASLAAQTYKQLEVMVIDDGSTDSESLTVFNQMQDRYPQFHFVHQANAGIGATRNRGLFEGRGEYFIPVDADNIACPDMVERFVAAIERRPDVAALTCYFLAFAETADIARGKFLYACRPMGGPHLLACVRNVYGDANAIYRTEAFRGVGGYEADRSTSFEDWEAFIKLVHAGHAIDVVPEVLFYYRHLPTGFSRRTSPEANYQRVLRQFVGQKQLSPGEDQLLWPLLTGLARRVEELESRQRSRRYRLVDGVHLWVRRLVRH